MSDFPDVPKLRYQLKKKLGQNRSGGRVTYLARDGETGQLVVIKQFQFANAHATWSGYDAFNQEVQVLSELDHPGIPHYLTSFHSDNGFYMVQEYKPASPLDVSYQFTPLQIRKIAVSLLEILTYLQSRIPPIIHRDIKPANILVDHETNVYLVDFGFARLGAGEVGQSSVVKGTLGFMPPEQIFNRQLTEASDLYGLGMTLICLITNTPPTGIGDLVDSNYRINLQRLSNQISLSWIRWLEKMVEPKVEERFANATQALAAMPGDLIQPAAVFQPSVLKFISHKMGRSETKSVRVHNLVSQTLLEGRWEVAPHPGDPPHTPHHHPWISFQPQQFVGNQVVCHVTIETRKLMSDQLYSRQLLCHTNASSEPYVFDLQVQTAPIAVQVLKPPYTMVVLCITLVFLIIVGLTVGLLMIPHQWAALAATSLVNFAVIAMPGTAVGFWVAAWMLATAGWKFGATASVFASCLGVLFSMLMVWATPTPIVLNWVTLAIAAVGAVSGLVSGIVVGVGVERLCQQGYSPKSAMVFLVLATGVGISLGLSWLVGFANPLVLLASVGTGLLLVEEILRTSLKRFRLLTEQRQAEEFLIKP
jgi:serine/threonine protein kinase